MPDINHGNHGVLSFPIFWEGVLLTTIVIAVTKVYKRVSVVTITYYINNYQLYGDVQTDYGQRDFRINYKPVVSEKFLTIVPDRLHTDDTHEDIFFTTKTEILITQG